MPLHARVARSPRPATLLALLGVTAACLQLPACAGKQPPPASAPVVNLDLEPMRVEVGRDARGGTRVAVFDARELFDRAGAALAANHYDQAVTLYDRLLADFPESQLVPPALFNAGLALEGRGDPDAAIARYLEVVRRAAATRYALDAHIRAGAVMAELSRWSDAVRLYDQVLARPDLRARDRIELQARRGYVLVESRSYPEAEQSLAAALELAQPGARAQRLETDYFVAMAQYYLGEVPRRQAEAMQLRLPEEQLQRDLEAKAKLVLVAQRRFEDTIRLGNVYWATAAGHQLGSMQQDMWRSLIGAPVPHQLRAKEAAIYTAEVGVLARQHLEKALAAHVMNVKVAELNRAQTPWSDSSRRRITEIEKLLASGKDKPGPTGAAAPSALPERSPVDGGPRVPRRDDL
jgi:tetratricopeptide (TPR) repeat protein